MPCFFSSGRRHTRLQGDWSSDVCSSDLPSNRIQVPSFPVIPFIEGDGTGPDIWAASVRVFDAAVKKAYGGQRKIVWFETQAGEKATKVYGEGVWLPDDTLNAIKEYKVGIKGPLTTPVGGGFRSVNVAL